MSKNISKSCTTSAKLVHRGIVIFTVLLILEGHHQKNLVEGTKASHHHSWERPGCHKVGHTRRVLIPECIEFTITTNACRGYCESFAVPSQWNRLISNPEQTITSVGQCCNIMDTEDVVVNVICVDGIRQLLFKSASSCSCYHCKKD